jgi:hypothetical protein
VTRAALLLCAVLSACRDDAALPAPEMPEPAAARPDAAPSPAAADELAPPPPEEEDLPAAPMPILSGQQAEQAIAGDVATPAPPPPGAHPWEITPTRLGAVRLGASRGELVMALKEIPRVRQRWIEIPQAGVRAGPMTPPSLEIAEVLDGRGIRMFRFRLLGGRVALAASGYADPAIATESDVGIGTTLEAAVEAHGDARPVTVTVGGERVSGLVLEDLPGVVFQVSAAGGPRPPAIFGVVVVGPEAD